MKKIFVWLIIGIVCIIIAIILANRIDGSFGLNKDSWLTLVIGGLGIFFTGVSGVKGFNLLKLPLKRKTFIVSDKQKSGDLYFITLENTGDSDATNIIIKNGNVDHYSLNSVEKLLLVAKGNKFTVELKCFASGPYDDISLIIDFDNKHGCYQKQVVKIPKNEVK